MPDIKERAVKEILNYKPVKYAILGGLILAILILGIILPWIHFSRCAHGRNSTLWWGANICQECKDTTVTQVVKVDTVVKDSIVYKAVYAKTNTPKNDQKNDRGSSGLQNNGTNNGQQAGGDINNYGSFPRRLDFQAQNQLLSSLPDKHEKIVITCLMGDGESFSFATSIKNLLTRQGYSNVDGVSQSVFSQPIIGQFVNRDSSGVNITIGSKP